MLKYESVAQAIRRLIYDTPLQAGDKLPSLATLKVQFQVSKSTLLKALHMLEKEGLLHQAHGSGIYVRNGKRPGYMNLFTSNGFSDDLNDHHITSTVLNCEKIRAPHRVKTHLQLQDEADVYYVKRIRYIDGAILCIETSYFNVDVVPFLDHTLAEGSIFDYIEQQLKIKIGYSDIYFNVDTLDADEANLLKQPTGSPTLRYEQQSYTNTGIPFDDSHIVFNHEHAHFYIPSVK